jgi:hypothetical protein
VFVQLDIRCHHQTFKQLTVGHDVFIFALQKIIITKKNKMISILRRTIRINNNNNNIRNSIHKQHQLPPQTLAHDHQRVDKWFKKASTALENGQYEKSIKYSTRTLDSLDQLERHFEEMELTHLQQVKDQRATLLNIRTSAQMSLGKDTKEIERDYKLAIRNNPMDATNYVSYACFLTEVLNRSDDAIPYLNIAIDLQPNTPSLLLLRADAYSSRKQLSYNDIELIISDTTNALLMNVGDPKAYYLRGEGLMKAIGEQYLINKLKQYPKLDFNSQEVELLNDIITDMNNCIIRASGFNDAYYIRVLCNCCLNHIEEAERDLQILSTSSDRRVAELQRLLSHGS